MRKTKEIFIVNVGAPEQKIEWEQALILSGNNDCILDYVFSNADGSAVDKDIFSEVTQLSDYYKFKFSTKDYSKIGVYELKFTATVVDVHSQHGTIYMSFDPPPPLNYVEKDFKVEILDQCEI